MEQVRLGQCLRFVEATQLAEVGKILTAKRVTLLRCLTRDGIMFIARLSDASMCK